MLIQNRQRLNLISFHSAYIGPMYSLLNRANEPDQHRPLRLFAKAALLESIGWMSLGAAVGHFNRTEAVELAETIHSNRTDIEEVSDEFGYLFDTEWLKMLNPANPPGEAP
jgi:hypothetical protein